MKNVLLTGASSVLGRRLTLQLRDRPDVERVTAVETAASADWIDGVELLSFGQDHRQCVEFLCDMSIDTVIHASLAPDRSGSTPVRSEANVIETMRLGAAVGHEGVPVRSWVVVSSSDVYPIDSHAPLLHREDEPPPEIDTQPALSLHEAEVYVVDVAARRPHLNVALMRLQQLCGPSVKGPLVDWLERPVLAAPMGFDPALQLLAIDDAIAALVFAAEHELAGHYNVASSGLFRLSEVGRLMKRRVVPVLPIEPGPLAGVARALGVPHVANGTLQLLRFGHAIDTAKLAAAGYRAEYDQRDCLAAMADSARAA